MNNNNCAKTSLYNFKKMSKNKNYKFSQKSVGQTFDMDAEMEHIDPTNKENEQPKSQNIDNSKVKFNENRSSLKSSLRKDQDGNDSFQSF